MEVHTIKSDDIEKRTRPSDHLGGNIFDQYIEKAEAGDSYAQYRVAKAFLKGDRPYRNYNEAASWFEKSAQGGFKKAQRKLALMYMYSQVYIKDGVIDYDTAFKWAYKAAQQGDLRAMSMVGGMYYFGNGTEKDFDKALQWLRPSAEGGASFAMFILGLMYYYGRGLEQDKDTAQLWFEKSAKFGNSSAGDFLNKHYIKENSDKKPDEIPNRPDFLSRALADQLTGENIIIPEIFTEMEAGAFSERQDIRHVTIPGGMTKIADNSFECSSLESISLPDELTEIGVLAFYKCNNIEQLDLPPNMKRIGAGAFNMLLNLKEIHFPEGLLEIGSSAFCDCCALTNVKIPDSLEVVGGGAFRDCDNLVEIHISSGHQYFTVHEGVLFDKEIQRLICFPPGLERTSYVLPESVREISDAAFGSCKKLQEIILHENLESIKYDAFYDCTNLKKINLPDSLVHLGKFAFYSCDFETIRLPSKLEEIPLGAFWNCRRLKDIYIPENITAIGPYAFRSCNSLETLKIPSSVTSIGSGAFMSSINLKEIYIPESVTFIGEAAFYTDWELTIVTPEGSFAEYYLDMCDGERSWHSTHNVDGGIIFKLA